jgi:hypothetical protein
MQLFQLAKEQLKSIHKGLPKIREVAASGKVQLPLSNVDMPIFVLKVFAEDDEKGLAMESNVPDILLPFKKDDDVDADYKAMEGGVNDFVFSALLVAFNMTQPTLPMDDMPAVRLAQDTEDGQYYLRFIQLDPEKFGVSAAAEALDKMELMMFSGWKKVPGSEPKELTKKFVNEEQAALAGHLINCMARASGYTEDEIESQFRASDDDGRILTINRELMKHLAEVEQTFHADFVRVKH